MTIPNPLPHTPALSTAAATEVDSPFEADTVDTLPGFEAPHPRALAHLGDAVYELFVREQALVTLGDSQSHALHRYCTHRVCAAYQAAWLHQWQDAGLLNEPEQAIVRRARNLPVTTKRRIDQGLYRQATGFEALLGWLHLTNQPRLAQLLATDPPSSSPQSEGA